MQLPKLRMMNCGSACADTQPGVATLRVHTGLMLFITVLMWMGNRNFKGLMGIKTFLLAGTTQQGRNTSACMFEDRKQVSRWL